MSCMTGLYLLLIQLFHKIFHRITVIWENIYRKHLAINWKDEAVESIERFLENNTVITRFTKQCTRFRGTDGDYLAEFLYIFMDCFTWWTSEKDVEAAPPLTITCQASSWMRRHIQCMSIWALGWEGVGRVDLKLRYQDIMGLKCDSGEPRGLKRPLLTLQTAQDFPRRHFLRLSLKCKHSRHITDNKDATHAPCPLHVHTLSSAVLNGCTGGGRLNEQTKMKQWGSSLEKNTSANMPHAKTDESEIRGDHISDPHRQRLLVASWGQTVFVSVVEITASKIN